MIPVDNRVEQRLSVRLDVLDDLNAAPRRRAREAFAEICRASQAELLNAATIVAQHRNKVSPAKGGG